MNSSLKSLAQSHADHRYWQSELNMWVEDVANWKAEQSDALTELKQIEEEISEHGEALDEHNEKTILLGTGLHAHEKEIAECLKTGVVGEMHEEYCSYHDRQASEQARQRDAHERIKKHHHQVMAQIAMLKAALETAM